MADHYCCFCKRSPANRRHCHKLFSGSLQGDIVAIVWDVFSAEVNLEREFTQQTIVCKDCRQLLVNFTKKKQELQKIESEVRSLLAPSLHLEVPPLVSPAVSPVQHAGVCRPPSRAVTSTPKRRRLQLEGSQKGQSPAVQVCLTQ